MTPWKKLEQLATIVLVVAVLNTVAFLLVATVDPFHKPPINDRRLLNAVFFTAQTLTTTGYGVGFEINDQLMLVGTVFMIVGSITWGILVGQIAAFIIIQTQLSMRRHLP